MNSEELLKKLSEELDINPNLHNHIEVHTVEAWNEAVNLPGKLCKNLFVSNKKGKLYLIVAMEDTNVVLKDVAKQINAPGSSLRFASEDKLEKALGVKQGAVTPFGLINDTEKMVEAIILDKEIENQEILYFHPLVNTQTIEVTYQELSKFLEHTGHFVIKF